MDEEIVRFIANVQFKAKYKPQIDVDRTSGMLFEKK